jgi:hypothetical protein
MKSTTRIHKSKTDQKGTAGQNANIRVWSDVRTMGKASWNSIKLRYIPAYVLLQLKIVLQQQQQQQQYESRNINYTDYNKVK